MSDDRRDVALPRRALRCLTLFVGLALVGGGPALAQQEEGQETTGDSGQSRQELLQEFNEVRQELAQIQEQAMEDSALQAMRDDLNESIAEAAEEVAPGSEQKMQRLQELQAEAQAAREEGDQEKLQSVMQEMQQIQQTLQSAQRQVLAREDIQQEYRAFEEAMLAEMEAVDPRTPDLVERMETLQQELQQSSPGR